MFTLETPRLILATTPLDAIKTRRQRDDFVAAVPLSVERAGRRTVESIDVRFPPEWPGDAIVLFPLWERALETNPRFEMWGGTMIDRAERIAVGQMTLSPAQREGTVELGYGVNPAYQGRGYATEAGRALVRWAHGEPRIREIIAECLDENGASIRVLEKIGFLRVGERRDEEGRMLLWEHPA